jgi:hypothetical protein
MRIIRMPTVTRSTLAVPRPAIRLLEVFDGLPEPATAAK